MEVETSREEKGTRITVHTDTEVAVIVRSEAGERIYLPPSGSGTDNYYVENPSSLVRSPEGYTVVHDGDIRDIQVLN